MSPFRISPRRWLTAAPPVGLSLGTDGASAAVLARRPGGWRVAGAARVSVAAALFEGAATPAQEQALAEALGRLHRELGATSRTVQVAVPDGAVSLRVFELERLPPTRRLRTELVRWRFAREFGRDGADFACSHQAYGQENGHPLLLGLAMAADWAALVQRACRAAGWLVVALDMRGCHRHNRLRNTLATPGHGGALVALDADAWSLSVWDDAGRLRLVRSGRRDPDGGEPSVDEAEGAIALDVERTVRAWAQGSGERSLHGLAVLGAPDEAARLAGRLDARLRETCTVIEPHAGLGEPEADAGADHLPAPWGLAAPAVDAAIPR